MGGGQGDFHIRKILCGGDKFAHSSIQTDIQWLDKNRLISKVLYSVLLIYNSISIY